MCVIFQLGLTSICICELSSPEEAQVACSGPDGLGISKTQSGVEMIRLERLISINGKIATGIVGTVDPDLWTERNTIVHESLCAHTFSREEELTVSTTQQVIFKNSQGFLGSTVWIHLLRCLWMRVEGQKYTHKVLYNKSTMWNTLQSSNQLSYSPAENFLKVDNWKIRKWIVVWVCL